MLWQRSLVMYDQETNSHWSHILGEAMEGDLRGAQLEPIPAVMTDWTTWREQHSDSTVLWMSPTARQFQRSYYRDPHKFVLGYTKRGKATAWGFEKLVSTPVLNETWGETPVLVTMHPESFTARLYDRRVTDKVLNFSEQDGKLVDTETSSEWDRTTGRAVAGAWAGKALRPLPAIVSFRHTWKAFHPDSAFSE